MIFLHDEAQTIQVCTLVNLNLNVAQLDATYAPCLNPFACGFSDGWF
jgi:hypothetical protein